MSVMARRGTEEGKQEKNEQFASSKAAREKAE